MEDNVFEQIAKRYDTEARIELAKVIVKEVRPELQNSTSGCLVSTTKKTHWGNKNA